MGRRQQQGIVLLTCLILLIMVMLLSVSAAQMYLQGEKAARGERDRDVAFQSAEDTLMDAELDIQCGPEGKGDPARCAAFDPAPATPQTPSSSAPPGAAPSGPAAAPGAPVASPATPAAPAFAAECGAGGAAGTGLRLRAPPGAPPVWQSVDLSGVDDGGACTASHGAFTGAEMQTGQGFLPFKKPRYLIERMECHQPGDDAAASAAPRYCYRVTAIGFAAKPGMEVVLQSVFAKPE